MRVSLQWLKEFVKLPVGARELAEELTRVGLTVETVDEPGRDIAGVLTGRVTAIKPHPNADRLVICMVDAGQGGEITVVTGADNMRVGDVVPVALEGAKLAGGLVIRRAKLRGVDSNGMMCSADELGVGEDHEGIMILDPNLPIGVDAKPFLGLDDIILELDLTPNRGDALSILGVARDAAAIFKTGLKYTPPESSPAAEAPAGVRIDIENPELCRRYVGRLIEDVKIGPSPLWMQQRLYAAGVRPISNIVDVTNYVMMELGQPMHAFDFDRLHGGHVIVRSARPGEKIVTLDGAERHLTPEMLLITDPKGPVAVAGVMGGFDSEVTAGTGRVLLEAAFFNPVSVRRTSRRLGLRSEASLRFEKGVDLEGCLRAADRAAQLIEEIGAGRAVPGAADAYPSPYKPRTIMVRPERVNRILGIQVPREEVAGILERLEFNPREADGEFVVSVPSYRHDVFREVDLVEEVVRMYGYDRVEHTLPYGATTPGLRSEEQLLLKWLKDLLTACGLTEVVTYSFVSRGLFERMRIPADSPMRDVLALQNPLSEEQAVMRTLLFPGLVELLARNYHRRNLDAAFFELAAVFRKRENGALPEERQMLAMALTGGAPAGWNLAPMPYDFFYVKGILEMLAAKLGLPEPEFRPADHPSFHPGRSAVVAVGDTVLGTMGELHPDVLESYELPAGVACELDMDRLIRLDRTIAKQYAGLPRFPSVERDLALIIEDRVPVREVVTLIRRAGGRLLKEVRLFDVYTGRQIEEGCRSLAFALRFQADDRTLTDDEVNKYLTRVLDRVAAETGAKLRQ